MSALLGAVSILAGCDDDATLDIRVQRCLAACEAGHDCPDSQGSVDCFALCDDLDAINRATDCWQAYDEVYDCIDRKGVCAANEECVGQQATYGDCIAENCSSDPDREECAL